MVAVRRRALLGAAVAPLLLAPLAVAAPAQASSTANEVVYTIDARTPSGAGTDGVYGVVIRQLDTGRVTTVLPEDPVNGWIYDDPELSPDGTQIVLSTNRFDPDGGEGLAVVNRDGTGLRPLTQPASTESTLVVDGFPTWSPSGDRVLFTRISISGTPPSTTEADELRTVPVGANPADGDDSTAVPGGTGGFSADWNPAGDRIVFAQDLAQDTGVGELFTMALDGTGKTSLGADGVLPAWSPDGTTIAFTEITELDPDTDRQADIAQIALVPAAGGAKRTLAKTRPLAARSVAEYPTWTPDSGAIVFDLYTYDTDGFLLPGDLWTVDRDDVRAGRVTSTASADEVQGHLQGPVLGTVSAGTASRFVPVDPKRLLDTRPGSSVGVAPGKVQAGDTRTLAIRGTAVTVDGAASTVPSDATAVVLNVTAVGASRGTDIRVYPTPATSVPGASALNAVDGGAVPNLVTVQIGADGGVVLRNSAGSVDLTADISGYYVPAATPGAAGFTPLDPQRVLETRSSGNVGAPVGKLGAGATRDLQVTGTLPTGDGGSVTVPADATAVVLNVTATGASTGTDVRVYPTPASGDAFPVVSNLNARVGVTAPNLVVVAVGEGGKVRLRNGAGTVDLIADLAGYYSAASTGQFVPVAPIRFLDTRDGTGAAPTSVPAGAFVDLRVAGSRGVPAGALAAVLNLTGTGVTGSTDVRAYPSDAASVPTVSNLNLRTGTTRANLAVVKPGASGAVRIRNAAASVQLIGDLAGYFRAPAA